MFAGILQPEVKITSYWRGFPKEFNSVISVPNEEKVDGYDYYAFAKGMLWLYDNHFRCCQLFEGVIFFLRFCFRTATNHTSSLFLK